MKARTVCAAAGLSLCALAVLFMLWEGSAVKESPAAAVARLPSGSSTEAQDGGLRVPLPEEGRALPVIAQENLSNLYIVKCSACHGRDGRGPVGPSIAGKSYEENLNKLKQYQRGEVENTLMKDMLARTSKEELEMLSREISAFR